MRGSTAHTFILCILYTDYVHEKFSCKVLFSDKYIGHRLYQCIQYFCRKGLPTIGSPPLKLEQCFKYFPEFSIYYFLQNYAIINNMFKNA